MSTPPEFTTEELCEAVKAAPRKRVLWTIERTGGVDIPAQMAESEDYQKADTSLVSAWLILEETWRDLASRLEPSEEGKLPPEMQKQTRLALIKTTNALRNALLFLDSRT